eukprot:gene1180-2299_t
MKSISASCLSKRLTSSIRNFYIPTLQFSTATPKKGNDKNKAKRSSNDSDADSMVKFVEMAEAAKRFKVEFPPEEKERHSKIAKEYQRQSTILSNQRNKDLTTKIWLQQEALRALPPALRLAAETIDDTSPPPDRPWAMYATPPIKDFNPQDYASKSSSDMTE